jgi:hypothetical protein
MQIPCYTCFGQGNVTCPACNGKGSYWKVVGMQNVWEPCYQCGGRKQFKCQTCDGKGFIIVDRQAPSHSPDYTPVDAPTSPLPPDPELLKLAGCWKCIGGRYELVRDNGGYSVTVFNFLGWKVGTGQATISGSTLTLTVKSFGIMITYDLQLNGDRLQGVTRKLGGLPLPFALKRA